MFEEKTVNARLDQFRVEVVVPDDLPGRVEHHQIAVAALRHFGRHGSRCINMRHDVDFPVPVPGLVRGFLAAKLGHPRIGDEDVNRARV